MASNEGNPISVRFPREVLASLDEVAGILDRSRSWLIVHAVNRYLSDHASIILETAKGAAELDRGDSEDMDDVLRDLDAIIDAAEARHS